MPIDPFFGSVAMGGLSALGNLGGGIMSAGGAAAQNAQQQAQFQQQVRIQQDQFDRNNQLSQWQYLDQKQWQDEMSRTAYQRAVADMRQAGINPMLAYMKGGASTPSSSGPGYGGGAGAPSAQAGVNTGEAIGRGISATVASALDAFKTVNTVENLKEQNALLKAQTANTQATVAKTNAEAGLITEQVKNPEAQRDLWKLQGEAASAAANASNASAYASTEYGRRQAVGREKEERHGYGTPADYADQVEKLARRVTTTITNDSRAAPGASPRPGRNPFKVPFTGLRNE